MTSASPQARHTLLSAIERFATTVTPEDQRVFNNTKLKDVRDEAIQVERQLRARRTQRNMARLEPFLRGVEHYSKVVEVLCNGTPFLPWIWAPVKLMLMITVDSIGAFEKLIDAYGKIADMMPRLDRLANALIDDFNFQNTLALVYSDIIEFHRRAYKFVRRKSWAIFFGSMWANFESRFDSILRSLADHSELVDKEAAAANISDAVTRHKQDSQKWEQQEREWETLKIRTTLSWLGTSDDLPADVLERHIRDCLPGSCDWFVNHDKTQLWLGDGAENALLWLYGKPGAGKSMICSSLVQQHTETQAITVLYYFCSFLGTSTDGFSRLLRSLICQIIQKHQDLAIYVHDVYFKSHPVPTKKALLSLLSELLRGLGSVRVIIDGVDEWDPRDQKELLKDVAQMMCTEKNSHICKILISSRDTLDLSRVLRKRGNAAAMISLSNTVEDLAVSRSIGQYVDKKLSDLPEHFTDLDPDASIVAQVKRTLLEKSHGMFLWVRLVLDSFDAVYSPEELRTIVNDLPTDLETLYARILERIYSAHGAHSHGGVARIISWICFAQRPLHKHELLHALSVPRNGVGSDTQSIPISSILDHCKPFVEERFDSTIVPVHFSVKEFFMRSRSARIIPRLQAELDLASVCVVTLVRGLGLLRPGTRSDNHARIASGSYRLLPYTLEFWIEHCFLYTSEGGALGLNCSLMRHLTRLSDAHRLLSTSLNCPGNDETPADDELGQQAEKLQPFSHLPAHGLMKEVLRTRRLAIERGCETGQDVEAFALQTDQTLFSKLMAEFERSILYLLSQQEVEGIPTATLRAFQASYESTALRCRYPQCSTSSLGFATQELRVQHETIHFQRVYCKVSTCQFGRVGFAKKSALTAHTRRYHAESTSLPIPSKIRRVTDKAEDGNTNETGARPVSTRPTSTEVLQAAQSLSQHNTPHFGPQGSNTLAPDALDLANNSNPDFNSFFAGNDLNQVNPPYLGSTLGIASPSSGFAVNPMPSGWLSPTPLDSAMRAEQQNKNRLFMARYEQDEVEQVEAPAPDRVTSDANMDRRMQIMLLEQQNKKRLLMARQEQDEVEQVKAPAPNGATSDPNMGKQKQPMLSEQQTQERLEQYELEHAQQSAQSHKFGDDQQRRSDPFASNGITSSSPPTAPPTRHRVWSDTEHTSPQPSIDALGTPAYDVPPRDWNAEFRLLSGARSDGNTASIGNSQAGLTQFIHHYRQQVAQGMIPQGWQQSVAPEERGQLCLQFYTQYRLLKPEDLEMEAKRTSLNFETQTFIASTSKDQYVNNFKSRLVLMVQARQAQLARMQQEQASMADIGRREPRSPHDSYLKKEELRRQRLEALQQQRMMAAGMSPSQAAAMAAAAAAGPPGYQEQQFAVPGQLAQDHPAVSQTLALDLPTQAMRPSSPSPLPAWQDAVVWDTNGPSLQAPPPANVVNTPHSAHPPTNTNHALQDYQTTLSFLERRNGVRLIEARIHQGEQYGNDKQYGDDAAPLREQLAQKKRQLEADVNNAGFYWNDAAGSYVRLPGSPHTDAQQIQAMPPPRPAQTKTLQEYQTTLLFLERRNKNYVLEHSIRQREAAGEDTGREREELAQKRSQLEFDVVNAGYRWDDGAREYVRTLQPPRHAFSQRSPTMPTPRLAQTHPLHDYQTAVFFLERRNRNRIFEANMHQRARSGEDTTRDQVDLAEKWRQLDFDVENAGFYWDEEKNIYARKEEDSETSTSSHTTAQQPPPMPSPRPATQANLQDDYQTRLAFFERRNKHRLLQARVQQGEPWQPGQGMTDDQRDLAQQRRQLELDVENAGFYWDEVGMTYARKQEDSETSKIEEMIRQSQQLFRPPQLQTY